MSIIQKTIQIIFKAVITGIVVSFGITATAFFIEMLLGRDFELNNELFREIGIYFLYGTVLTLINSTFFNYINFRPWKKYKQFRFVVGVVGSVVLTTIGIFIIRYVTDVLLNQMPLPVFLAQQTVRSYLFSILLTLVISLLFHAIYFYKQMQEVKVKEQKIIAGNASARFETLKNQIDPHFLFNSLNVLSSLIEENPDNAQKFTTSLSKIYRYVLEQKDKELVPLEEELKFAKTYLNLLQMRFEGSLQYELPEIQGNDESKVVPLSLQLLLENTIKHNVVSPQKPLKVRIYIKDNNLVVENDLQRKEVLKDREGVGLQNIVSRYSILTKRSVQILESETTFAVAIPILTEIIEIMEQTDTQSQQAYIDARKRVEDIKGFYGNLMSYVLVNLGLITLNLLTTPDKLWFFWPLLGWGIGVLFHAMSVFNFMPFFGADWEKRKVQELLDKEKQNKYR
ncbi:2TM domain-containing protein [Flavobacterium sp.]|uniref:2TM domain-containing protein n=1 Tax=Flavobacterium sp. TaxID=239 RepID=UPI003B9D8691